MIEQVSAMHESFNQFGRHGRFSNTCNSGDQQRGCSGFKKIDHVVKFGGSTVEVPEPWQVGK